MDIIEKAGLIAKRVLNICIIILGACLVGLLCVVVVSLISLTPEEYLKNGIKIVSGIGSLLAGVGTVALAVAAFLAYGEWKIQLGAKYAHDCIFQVRKAQKNLMPSIRDLCYYLNEFEKVLNNKESNIGTENLLSSIKDEFDVFRSAHSEYFASLEALGEISGEKYRPKGNKVLKLNISLGDLCREVINKRTGFDFSWVELYDNANKSNLKDIFIIEESGSKYLKTISETINFSLDFDTTLTKYAEKDFHKSNSHLNG